MHDAVDQSNEALGIAPATTDKIRGEGRERFQFDQKCLYIGSNQIRKYDHADGERQETASLLGFPKTKQLLPRQSDDMIEQMIQSSFPSPTVVFT